MRKSLVVPFLLAGAFCALAQTGCDEASGASPKDVEGLKGQVRKLEDENRDLKGRLETTERRLAGLAEDVSLVRKTAVDAGSASEAAAAALKTGVITDEGPINPDPSAGARTAAQKEMIAFLESDTGRKAVEQTLQVIEKKREAERQEQAAARMVDAFSLKANLTPQQNESLKKIVAKSLTDLRGVWDGMRGDGSMTPEERQTARLDAVAKMGEITTRTEEEARTVLDTSQFQMFQEEAARMRNRGGFGVPGGFGGGGQGGDGGMPGGQGGQGGTPGQRPPRGGGGGNR